MYTITQAELVLIQEAAKRCPWELADTIMRVVASVAARPPLGAPDPASAAAPPSE